jgi:hypothetical protein
LAHSKLIEKPCSSYWDNLTIFTGMLQMKNQIRKVQHLEIATSLPTNASLIQPKLLAVSQAGSVADIDGVNENALSTAAFYKSDPDGAFFRGKTTTGLSFYSGIIK